MARLVRLVCPEYEFTDEELVLAATLSELQKQFIQTQVAQLTLEKSTISYTPDTENASLTYIVEQEFKRGQLLSFQYLLDCHDGAQEQLRVLHAQRAASQEADSPG